jgi:hypothetical protein
MTYGDDNYQLHFGVRRWYPVKCMILGWRWI